MNKEICGISINSKIEMIYLNIAKNKDALFAICRICLVWTYGLYDGLSDTLDYVRKEHPEEREKFISLIDCLYVITTS